MVWICVLSCNHCLDTAGAGRASVLSLKSVLCKTAQPAITPEQDQLIKKEQMSIRVFSKKTARTQYNFLLISIPYIFRNKREVFNIYRLRTENMTWSKCAVQALEWFGVDRGTAGDARRYWRISTLLRCWPATQHYSTWTYINMYTACHDA